MKWFDLRKIFILMLNCCDKILVLLEYTVLVDNFSISLFLKSIFKARMFHKNTEEKWELKPSKIIKFVEFKISSISIIYCIKFICCIYYKHVKTFNKKSKLLLLIIIGRVDSEILCLIFFHRAEIAQLMKHSFVIFFQNS